MSMTVELRLNSPIYSHSNLCMGSLNTIHSVFKFLLLPSLPDTFEVLVFCAKLVCATVVDAGVVEARVVVAWVVGAWVVGARVVGTGVVVGAWVVGARVVGTGVVVGGRVDESFGRKNRNHEHKYVW